VLYWYASCLFRYFRLQIPRLVCCRRLCVVSSQYHLPKCSCIRLDCADTSILRTRSRQELLYTRSQIAIAAKAFGLESVDMVCVHYKDLDYLKEECEDGRRLGFSGKVHSLFFFLQDVLLPFSQQAIHPSQVDTIQSTFVPSESGTSLITPLLYSFV